MFYGPDEILTQREVDDAISEAEKGRLYLGGPWPQAVSDALERLVDGEGTAAQVHELADPLVGKRIADL